MPITIQNSAGGGVTLDSTTSSNETLNLNTPVFTGTVTADNLQVSGTGVSDLQRSHSTTTASLAVLDIKAKSTGDMAAGFGSAARFIIEDTANVENVVAEIAARRESSDSTAALTFTTSTTEKMRIDSSGSVGIGTSSPASGKHLHINDSVDWAALRLTGGGGNFLDIKSYGDSSSGTIIETGGDQPLRTYVNGAERMRVSSAGQVGINTTSANTRLQVSGNSANNLASYFCVEGTYPVVYYRDTEANQNSFATYCDGSSFFIQSVPYANRNDANPSSSFQTGVYLSSNSGSWGSTSDENLKTNLVPIENGLAKVNTLRSVIGEFIDDAESKRAPFLIAQDVQAVLPEAVETVVQKVTDENGEEGSSSHLGLQYTAVIPLLVAAIKELSDKNDALETQNAAFDARLTALEGAAP